jgi:hypothetical protein
MAPEAIARLSVLVPLAPVDGRLRAISLVAACVLTAMWPLGRHSQVSAAGAILSPISVVMSN